MKLSVYQDGGFRLLNELAAGGTFSMPAAIVNILKGSFMVDDTSGYATNTATGMTAIILGVAAEPVNNSGGSLGTLDVLIIPPLPQYRWSVPCDANTVITRDHVGTYVDLGTDALHVALNVNPTEGWAFWIEDFDASAEAVAAHTYGYAIGRLRTLGTQAGGG